MKNGQILVAEQNGTNVIKMVGDVRLVLCISFDNFIEKMFSSPVFRGVIFDLRSASGIDSTTLGLMAKISIRASEFGYAVPLVITNSPSILRLLESMGFEDIFELVSEDSNSAVPLSETLVEQLPSHAGEPLPADTGNEIEVKARIIEAHKILMDLNSANQAAFHELVETLESDTL